MTVTERQRIAKKINSGTDGRNRKAACEIAGIEPISIQLDGQDPVAFIVSRNLKRRQLTKGQQAMLVALGLRKMRKSANQAAKENSIDHQRISRAVFIIEDAPDQIELVLAGTPLETAYEEAQRRKRAAYSDFAKAERLNNQAPDLVEQVSEGKLSLAEAIGALDAREAEAKEARLVQRTRILCFY